MRFAARVAYTIAVQLLLSSVPSLSQTEAFPQTGFSSANALSSEATTSNVISTVAGDGTFGFAGDGGAATKAELNHPFGAAFDKAGNMYIADYTDCVVRKVVMATGIISTFAGNDVKGCGFSGDGAQATAAQLNFPADVKFDAAGNLYIADQNNNVVRKVTPAGVISTYAGSATVGYSGDGGPATKAEMNWPDGIALDAAGNLYIGEYNNHTVRKVTAKTGIITTYAGTGTSGNTGNGGPANKAELSQMGDVIVDAAGNVYIADQNNYVVRVVNAKTGDISVAVGTGVGGNTACNGAKATATPLGLPYGVAFDALGDLYVADYGANRVCKLNLTTGAYTAVAGTGTSDYNGDGIAPISAELSGPAGLVFDQSGNLYITEGRGSRVRKVTFKAAAAPTFSPVSGTFANTQSVTITAATPGSVIYYTTNGAAPTTSSPQYGGAIPVTETTTIKAIAVASGFDDSAVVAATFTIDQPAATPAFSPAGGTFAAAQSVTITDATKGAVIYYTLNGTAPTTASAKYTTAISVQKTETIEAIAVATGSRQSATAMATYTITDGPSPTPTFTVPAGTYGTEKLVSFADKAAGAVYYYTLNGAIPTTSSTKYTVPIPVFMTETLKVIAIAPGYVASAVATAAYVIAPTPAVLTTPATSLTASAATLNALVTSEGASATYLFQYGTSAAALTAATPQKVLTATSSPAGISAPLSGLKSKTVYYFRAVVTTVGGSATSAVLSFTTD